MTFTLASAASGVIRDAHWEYNNYTLGRIRTLLLEGARTNLVAKSSDMTGWTFTRTAGTQNATGPDGTANSAVTVAEDSSATTTHFFQVAAGAMTANTAQAISIFVKANGRTRGRFYIDGNINGQFGCEFDLTAVTATSFTGGVGPASTSSVRIVSHSNGWYRLEVVGICDLLSTTGIQYIFFENAAGSTSYSGDGASGMLVYGEQHERDTTNVSSHIPTTGVSATRNADVLTVPHKNPPGPLSFYARFVESGSSAGKNSANRVFTIGNGSGYLTVYPDSNGIYLAEHYNGSTYSSAGPGSMVAPARGDLVELLMVVDSTGKATITQVINSGTPVSASGAANAFMAAWPSLVLTLNAASGSGAPGFIAFNAIHVEMAVLTLAEMRTLAGV